MLNRPALISIRSSSAKFIVDHTTSISDFYIGPTIGKGSFGKVKICQHKSSGFTLVLKTIKKSIVTTEDSYTHLKNEKCVLSLISSPYTTNFFGSFTDEKFIYFALEYIPGGELFRYLKSRKRLSLQHTRAIAAEITSAFISLHDRGIIYKDLKPENILFTASGHIKLVDFGFAALLESGQQCQSFCGTLEYLAPELIDGQHHDFAVDWWTLGVLIYELIIGRSPFMTKNSANVLYNIQKKSPKFPEGFDQDAEDLICKLLDKDAKTRIGGESIKEHAFFKNIDWGKVERCEAETVWRPVVRHEMDTSNYETCLDSPAGLEENITFSFDEFNSYAN